MTVGSWRKHCLIDDLLLSLTGHGRFTLRFGLHRLRHADRWLDERQIELHEDEETLIALSFWAQARWRHALSCP